MRLILNLQLKFHKQKMQIWSVSYTKNILKEKMNYATRPVMMIEVACYWTGQLCSLFIVNTNFHTNAMQMILQPHI